MLRTTLLSLPLVVFGQFALAGGGCSDGHYNAQIPQMTEAPEVAMSAPVAEEAIEEFAVATALPCDGLEGSALVSCQALQTAE